MLIYANGEWVNSDDAVVPFADQGFLYGESLFETIRINQGQPFRLKKHLDRMRRGMHTIRMDAQNRLDEIPDILMEFISKNNLENALTRIIITRGIATGSPWKSPSLPAIYMTSRPINSVDQWPVKVVFFEEKNYPILRFHPAIKSSNYLGNMLAKKDAEAAGAFEPVFVNDEGYVTECAIRNIFFIRQDSLLTPTLELGVLPGVIRDTIMELAEIRQLNVEETYIRHEEIHTMDEAFISSTGVGVLPVFWEGFTSEYHHSKVLREDLQNIFQTGDAHVT